MKSILSVKNLTYKNLFSNLTIDFKSNNFNIISGPNSSGKTTLIKLLSKKLPSTKEIIYDNELLEKYNSSKIYNLFQTILADENYYFKQTTVENIINSTINKKDNNVNVINLSKKLLIILRLNKHIKDNPNNLEISTKLKLRLLLALIVKPKYLLIDNLTAYLDEEEKDTILTLLKELSTEITIILTTNNLDDTLYANYLYIIKSKVQLEGKPLEVLAQDNTLNKLGLSLPYMVDLSVKLKDYDLIKEIELDWNKLVNELWK